LKTGLKLEKRIWWGTGKDPKGADSSPKIQGTLQVMEEKEKVEKAERYGPSKIRKGI